MQEVSPQHTMSYDESHFPSSDSRHLTHSDFEPTAATRNFSKPVTPPNRPTTDSVTAHLLLDDFLQEVDLWSPFSGNQQTFPRTIADCLSAVALLANVGSLIAIVHTPGHMSVNLRLIVSLSLSDILIAATLAATSRRQDTYGSEFDACLTVVGRGLQNTSHVVSLLNLLGLAIDHYFAICRPIEHHVCLRPRMVIAMIVAFWTGSLVIGYSDMFYPFGDCSCFMTPSTYCRGVRCSAYDSEYVSLPLAVIILIPMMVMYGLIYRQVRGCQVPNVEPHSRCRRLVRRNVRGLYTTLIIVGAFVVCWMPYCVFVCAINVLLYLDSDTMQHTVALYRVFNRVEFYLYDLILLNCLIDPFIYAARMREVQAGYRRIATCLSSLRVGMFGSEHGDVSHWSVGRCDSGKESPSPKQNSGANRIHWFGTRHEMTSDSGPLPLSPRPAADELPSTSLTSSDQRLGTMVQITLNRVIFFA